MLNLRFPRCALGVLRGTFCRPVLSVWWLAVLLGGCATPEPSRTNFSRPFVFGHDTFAFANELVWAYDRDPVTGKLRHKDREPPPTYSHHCFVVARSARQFFQHASFDPARPVADPTTYRSLIHQIVATSLRRNSVEPRVVIPGYPDLFAFSSAQEQLLKKECGGAWQSYFQRGHWRMVFPFTGSGQARTAAQLCQSIRQNRPPVVHLVRFPDITINHAAVLFDARETADEIRFAVYDPFDPAKPAELIFDRKAHRFLFPANPYFIGGRVDVYEVYCSWRY